MLCRCGFTPMKIAIVIALRSPKVRRYVLNWRRDPKATLLIESGHEYAELKGLMVRAETEIVEDQAVVVDTLVNINSPSRIL